MKAWRACCGAPEGLGLRDGAARSRRWYLGVAVVILISSVWEFKSSFLGPWTSRSLSCRHVTGDVTREVAG